MRFLPETRQFSAPLPEDRVVETEAWTPRDRRKESQRQGSGAGGEDARDRQV